MRATLCAASHFAFGFVLNSFGSMKRYEAHYLLHHSGSRSFVLWYMICSSGVVRVKRLCALLKTGVVLILRRVKTSRACIMIKNVMYESLGICIMSASVFKPLYPMNLAVSKKSSNDIYIEKKYIIHFNPSSGSPDNVFFLHVPHYVLTWHRLLFVQLEEDLMAVIFEAEQRGVDVICSHSVAILGQAQMDQIYLVTVNVFILAHLPKCFYPWDELLKLMLSAVRSGALSIIWLDDDVIGPVVKLYHWGRFFKVRPKEVSLGKDKMNDGLMHCFWGKRKYTFS